MKKINISSLARRIANNMWGEVNTSYPTNQNFTYYYSCSWHGWYVVYLDWLNEEQKDLLYKFYWNDPYMVNVAVDELSWKTKLRATWNENAINSSERYKNYKFITFEEDCEWAIAEVILWIHTVDIPYDQKRIDSWVKTVKSYFSENLEKKWFNI